VVDVVGRARRGGACAGGRYQKEGCVGPDVDRYVARRGRRGTPALCEGGKGIRHLSFGRGRRTADPDVTPRGRFLAGA